jgi:integrase
MWRRGLAQVRARAGWLRAHRERNLSRLRSTLAKAVEWGLLETNPIASIKPLRFDKTLKVRYLTPDQEARLFAALEKREQDMREARARYNEWRAERGIVPLVAHPEPFADYLRPLVLVVRNTGLRRSEALSLRWADVDLVHKVIAIRGLRSKTQQTRPIPLNSVALETFRMWRGQRAPADDNEFVFGQDPQDRQLRICAAWRGVRKTAGLGDLRFHDLRHHFASKLVQKGADLNTVRELLGHASIDMTLAYAHLAPDGLAAAVEQIV